MQISIVMVDGGFRENFSSLKYWLNQTLEEEEYELIWVDYTDEVASEVKTMPGVRCFTVGRHDEPQILAHAYNRGIREARGDIIVIPDADVVCEEDLLETIVDEISEDPQLVLYILRLDQPEARFRPDPDLHYLRRTCSIKNTFNYGGGVAVRREHLITMNGYEQLPFFAGRHHNGTDNYIRFKNMGLKIRWHPRQRVYHAWHPLGPRSKRNTIGQQSRFIQHRAAAWEWWAYQGMDPSRNRAYDPPLPLPSEWESVMTERGRLWSRSARHHGAAVNGGNASAVLRNMRNELSRYGWAKGGLRIAGKALTKTGKALTSVTSK